jgi:hypothetical protein
VRGRPAAAVSNADHDTRTGYAPGFGDTRTCDGDANGNTFCYTDRHADAVSLVDFVLAPA